MIGQLFFLIFVFAGVIVLAYYSTKWIASAKHSRRGGNLNLIESMSIGHQSAVALIRAGKKVLLIGVTKDNIGLLSEMEEDSISIPETKTQAIPISFEKYLKKYFSRTEDISGRNPTTDNITTTNDDKR
ncbi:MAG: flagellar biosynthetic protein FliO [Clostridiales bacterium]|nr:flagellar biosynthetic protein FliO [Clostridiales bacterium]